MLWTRESSVLYQTGMSIKIYIILLMSAIILISYPGTGYFLMINARNAVLEEKQAKLFGLAKLLDDSLDRSFAEIVSAVGMERASRDEKIRILNEVLSRHTDFIANAETGIGVGYYSKDLDAIITYGPSSDLGSKVGQSISQTHKGREVMRTGQKVVQTASLVRGEIMNCMYPVIRNGETIGYIWANELVEDIRLQTEQMEDRFILIIFLGIIISLIGTALIANSISTKVTIVKKGLKKIQEDFAYRIPEMGGEIGEIATAVNEVAAALSQRRQLEQQMQRADKLAALGEVAAGVAHEIRNPMTAVKGFIQLIEEDLPPESPHREYTGIAIYEVNRMNKIVEELLYYARPSESSKMKVDINQILEAILTLVDFKIKKSNVTVTRNFTVKLPRIYVDDEQIRQVFLNLIINSTQAIEDKGTIIVSSGIADDGKSVYVGIEDTGKGIDAKDLERLFDPFYTTRKNGTGLGLAVVQRIVELHEGKIKVESIPGRKTVFTVELPVSNGDR